MSDSADEKSAFDEPVSKDRAQKKERRELSFEEQVADLSRFIQFEPLVRESVASFPKSSATLPRCPSSRALRAISTPSSPNW